jgi:hypothetical protein
MPAINLELQMKFLNDLDSALDEAMAKHRFEDDKMTELRYMHAEVLRAREVVIRRLRVELADERAQAVRSRPVRKSEEYIESMAV